MFLLFAFFLQGAVLVASFSTRRCTDFIQCAYQCKNSDTQLGVYSSPKSSPLEDEPWNKDTSYWDMLQEAAKDPATFEKFIEESTRRKKMGKSYHNKQLEPPEGETKPKKKGKYVPIEEWDAQQKDNMSAEERLQWECQRGGNQLRQNDILMHHLNSF